MSELAATAKVLRLLEEIGGEVADEELRHHAGPNAGILALQAAGEGLVTVRSTFELSPAGRALIGVARGGGGCG